MGMSASIKEFAVALNKAQSAIKAAVKDKTNPAFKSRYADLASIWEACREALAANGLSVVQTTEPHGEGGVCLVTILLHTSGEYVSGSLPLLFSSSSSRTGAASTGSSQSSPHSMSKDLQALGSAMSYARRYALAAIVGVVTEDDDGNHASSTTHAADRMPSLQEIQQNKERLSNMVNKVADSRVRLTGTTNAISEAQRRRLYKIASEAGWSNDELHEFVEHKLACKTKDVPWPQYDALWKEVQNSPKKKELNEEPPSFATDEIPF